MNQENNTIVSAEMLEQLKKLGLDKGYCKVPETRQKQTEDILAGRDIAELDEPTKNDFKNEFERLKWVKKELAALRMTYANDREKNKA